MENKVTSYETSKALAEAGFDIQSHTGWWLPFKDGAQWDKQITITDLYFIQNQGTHTPDKAYDCHDLLMWLVKNTFPSFTLRGFKDLHRNYFEVLEYKCEHKRPQEVLAKAVIEILKEDS